MTEVIAPLVLLVTCSDLMEGAAAAAAAEVALQQKLNHNASPLVQATELTPPSRRLAVGLILGAHNFFSNLLNNVSSGKIGTEATSIQPSINPALTSE